MLRMKICGVLVLLICFQVATAFESELISERPGQALSPNCLNKGSFQLQTGLDYSSFTNNAGYLPTIDPFYNFPLSGTGLLSNSVLRFGLGSKFEINTVLDFGRDNEALSSPLIGFKAALIQQEVTNISLQYNTILHQFNNDPFFSDLRVIATHTLTNMSGFYWNAGIQYTPELEDLNGNYVAGISLTATKRIGLIIENYGNYTDRFNTYFDMGIAYLLTPVIQLDTYFGGGINHSKEEIFVNAGLTYRLDYKRDE